MRNAYQTLGIPERLVVSEAELAAVFREAGARTHPDAGGAEDDFAELRWAMAILTSPSQRLRHWLEIRGCQVDPRGTVDAGLMDLFAEVGALSQRAEALVRKRGEARSALGLALLEPETQECREAVESLVAAVERAIERETAGFPELERAEDPDAGALSETVRNLAFLEKWRASLRSLFSRLV